MKFLLNGKYLVSPDVLSQIVEVERGGDYSDPFYKIIGEPSLIEVVKDSHIVQGDDAVHKEEEYASQKLEKAEKELDDLKLKMARTEAIDRILKEKRGLSRVDIEAYINSETSTYFIGTKTSDDVRKWLRKKQAD